jgi:hypothetical protein
MKHLGTHQAAANYLVVSCHDTHDSLGTLLGSAKQYSSTHIDAPLKSAKEARIGGIKKKNVRGSKIWRRLSWQKGRLLRASEEMRLRCFRRVQGPRRGTRGTSWAGGGAIPMSLFD